MVLMPSLKNRGAMGLSQLLRQTVLEGKSSAHVKKMNEARVSRGESHLTFWDGTRGILRFN
jgi:hypothetical protein